MAASSKKIKDAEEVKKEEVKEEKPKAKRGRKITKEAEPTLGEEKILEDQASSILIHENRTDNNLNSDKQTSSKLLILYLFMRI